MDPSNEELQQRLRESRSVFTLLFFWRVIATAGLSAMCYYDPFQQLTTAMMSVSSAFLLLFYAVRKMQASKFLQDMWSSLLVFQFGTSVTALAGSSLYVTAMIQHDETLFKIASSVYVSRQQAHDWQCVYCAIFLLGGLIAFFEYVASIEMRADFSRKTQPVLLSDRPKPPASVYGLKYTKVAAAAGFIQLVLGGLAATGLGLCIDKIKPLPDLLITVFAITTILSLIGSLLSFIDWSVNIYRRKQRCCSHVALLHVKMTTSYFSAVMGAVCQGFFSVALTQPYRVATVVGSVFEQASNSGVNIHAVNVCCAVLFAASALLHMAVLHYDYVKSDQEWLRSWQKLQEIEDLADDDDGQEPPQQVVTENVCHYALKPSTPTDSSRVMQVRLQNALAGLKTAPKVEFSKAVYKVTSNSTTAEVDERLDARGIKYEKL